MARTAKVAAPGPPHHVTHKDISRQQTFFNGEDHQAYLELMPEWCTKNEAQIRTYYFMPNHFHLVAVPKTKDVLNLVIGEAQRRYARLVNFRQGWGAGIYGREDFRLSSWTITIY